MEKLTAEQARQKIGNRLYGIDGLLKDIERTCDQYDYIIVIDKLSQASIDELIELGYKVKRCNLIQRLLQNWMYRVTW